MPKRLVVNIDTGEQTIEEFEYTPAELEQKEYDTKMELIKENIMNVESVIVKYLDGEVSEEEFQEAKAKRLELKAELEGMYELQE